MANEQIICGFNAVMAAVRHRPAAIQKLFFSEEFAPRFGKVCRTMAQERKLYRVCPPAELEKVSQSSHHGGVVALFTPREAQTPFGETVATWAEKPSVILALDGVANPHNLGALVRTAAFLGVKDIVVDLAGAKALQTPSALRIAEGGVEAVAIWAVPSVEEFLTKYRGQLRIIGTDQHAKISLRVIAQDVADSGRPVVLILGNEEEGMSPSMRALCHDLVSINGSGAVESLNVVQAAAIFLYALLDDPVMAENPVPAQHLKSKVTRIFSGLPEPKPPKRKPREPMVKKDTYAGSPHDRSRAKLVGGKKVVLVKRRRGSSGDQASS